MTLIRVRAFEDGNGGPRLVTGEIVAESSRPRRDGDAQVLPSRVVVKIVDGVPLTDVILEPSGADWYWTIQVATASRRVVRRVTVPDVSVIDWDDLVDIDPTTMLPDEGAVPAWEAIISDANVVLADVRDARDGAVGARDSTYAARDAAVAAARDTVVDARREQGELILVTNDAREINVGRVDGLPGVNSIENDAAVAAYVLAGSSETSTAMVSAVAAGAEKPASPIGMAVSRAQIMPHLTPIMERAEPLRIVMVQQPDMTVYATWSRTGEVPRFEKSTDGGLTWVTRVAALPVIPKAIAKLASGTLLLVQETGTTQTGGSNPKVYRSTDDGATWLEVAAGLTFPPLGSQGVCEGTDGSVMIGEYGNIGSHSYRIRRSADDGVTWATVYSSAGTDPQGDPGHIHSVTYDKYAGKHVAISDRAAVPGSSGPKIIASSNNGATWELLGESDTPHKPNFVAPMYFENYIAWGSDNHINGRVSRIRRSDFYAGNFDMVETVAQLDQKAAYFTFPLRDGVWLMCQNVEHINSSAQTGGVGSHASTVYVVDADGARVSGGIESFYASLTTGVGVNPGTRASFPSHAFDTYEHGGFGWVNMPVGFPRAYQATPVTQGWSPPTALVTPHSIPVLKRGARFWVERASGLRAVMDGSSSSYVAVGPDAAAGSVPHLRFMDTGEIVFHSGTGIVATIPAGGSFAVPGRIDTASNGTGLRAGSGSPEGVVAAPQGSLYQTWSGDAIWFKHSGSSSTGWRRLTPVVLTAAQIGDATHLVNASAKYEGQQVFDSTNNKPLWASGATATAAWTDATGAVAITPA